MSADELDDYNRHLALWQAALVLYAADCTSPKADKGEALADLHTPESPILNLLCSRLDADLSIVKTLLFQALSSGCKVSKSRKSNGE